MEPNDGADFQLRDISRRAMVRHLCFAPELTRAEVAQQLCIPPSTVGSLARKLLAEGWLSEAEGTPGKTRGRRSGVLEIRRDHLMLLGLDIGLCHLRVVVTSLMGDALHRIELEQPVAADADLRLEIAAQLLLEASAWAESAGGRVVGVGVGVPGRVDSDVGAVVFAREMGWANVPVARLLLKHLRASPLQGIPLHVQNCAHVAATGELEFGGSALCASLLYLRPDLRVDASVVCRDPEDGHVERLSGGAAHISLAADGPPCPCGRFGCAETLVGFQALLPGSPGPLGELKARLAGGDARTTEAVERAGQYLGLLISNLAVLHGPARIVLGGGMTEFGPAYVEAARRSLAHDRKRLGMPAPAVSMSRFGADDIAIGAAAFSRYHLTRPLSPVGRVSFLLARYGYRYNFPASPGAVTAVPATDNAEESFASLP